MLRDVGHSLQAALAVPQLVAKATNKEKTLLNEDILEEIMARIRGDSRDMFAIVSHLRRRLCKKNWVVVLKALFVVRRILCQEGKVAALALLGSKGTLGMSEWVDDSSREATRNSAILRHFAQYLDELAVACVDVEEFVPGSWEELRPKQRYSLIPVDELLEKTSTMLRALESLMRCEFDDVEIQTPDDSSRPDLMTSLLLLIIKDGLGLYGILEEARIIVVDEFFRLKKASAENALRFISSVDECMQILTGLCSLIRLLSPIYAEALPELQPISQGLLACLHDHVDTLPDDGSASKGKSKERPKPLPRPLMQSARASNDDLRDNVPVHDLASILGTPDLVVHQTPAPLFDSMLLESTPAPSSAAKDAIVTSTATKPQLSSQPPPSSSHIVLPSSQSNSTPPSPSVPSSTTRLPPPLPQRQSRSQVQPQQQQLPSSQASSVASGTLTRTKTPSATSPDPSQTPITPTLTPATKPSASSNSGIEATFFEFTPMSATQSSLHPPPTQQQTPAPTTQVKQETTSSPLFDMSALLSTGDFNPRSPPTSITTTPPPPSSSSKHIGPEANSNGMSALMSLGDFNPRVPYARHPATTPSAVAPSSALASPGLLSTGVATPPATNGAALPSPSLSSNNNTMSALSSSGGFSSNPSPLWQSTPFGMTSFSSAPFTPSQSGWRPASTPFTATTTANTTTTINGLAIPSLPSRGPEAAAVGDLSSVGIPSVSSLSSLSSVSSVSSSSSLSSLSSQPFAVRPPPQQPTRSHYPRQPAPPQPAIPLVQAGAFQKSQPSTPNVSLSTSALLGFDDDFDPRKVK